MTANQYQDTTGTTLTGAGAALGHQVLNRLPAGQTAKLTVSSNLFVPCAPWWSSLTLRYFAVLAAHPGSAGPYSTPCAWSKMSLTRSLSSIDLQSSHLRPMDQIRSLLAPPTDFDGQVSQIKLFHDILFTGP